MGRRLIDYDLLLHSKMINFIENKTKQISGPRAQLSNCESFVLKFYYYSIQSDRIYYHNNENKTVLQKAFY